MYNIFCIDDDILKVCNTHDLKNDELRIKIEIFGKTCLSINISENFEKSFKFNLD